MYGEFVGRTAIALVLVLAGLNLVFTVVDAVGEDDIWAVVVVALATLLGTAWGEAVMVQDIHDQREGRDAAILELFARTWRVAVRVAWATFLAGLVIGALFLVAFFFATLFVVDEWTLLAALLIAAAPALFLAARWSLLLPVIVIERRTTSAAFARSTQLVLPYRWTVLFVVVLGFVVGLVFDAVLVSAIERFTSGSLEFWLTTFVDGLIYTSIVIAVSTTLYYELVSADSRGTGKPGWQGEPERWEADLDITRFAR